MATSSVYSNLANSSYSFFRILAEASASEKSTSINDNSSTISYSVKVTFKPTNGYGFSGTSRPNAGYVDVLIGGYVVKTVTVPFNNGITDGTVIVSSSGTTTVAHNSDGTGSTTIQVKVRSGTDQNKYNFVWNNATGASSTLSLTTIPRATTISSITSEVYVNGSNSIAIALDRKSTNFTQNVTIKANDTYQTTITNSDVNVSYTIPVTWINAIGSNASISGTVSVTTYNGSTQIGDTQTSTFTLKKATPSTITCTDSIECNGSNILRVGITRQNTAFLHTVNFVFGSYSQSFTDIEYLKEYAPPMTWLNAIPNATSGKGTVTVTTYYGSISLGSNSKDFELVVPTSVVPSISSFTSSVVNPSQMSSWGVYVQGYTQAKLTINASGSYGSTISEWYFDGVSQSSNTKTTEAITQSGTVTFKAKVKDSRGRTSSEETVSISVNEYSTPVLIKNLLKRCLSDETIDDEGTYVLANFTFLYSSCAGKNSISTKIYSREITAESWTDNGTLTSGVNKKISSFDISKPYAIKVVSTDGVGNEATYVDVIETSNAIIDILKGGNGMGLGMMSSKANTLQIGFPYIEVDNGIFYINYTDKTTGKTVKSQIGSQNGSYMHYLTDAENGNYFNKKITVDNGLIVTGHADIGSEKVNGSLEVDGVSNLKNDLVVNRVLEKATEIPSHADLNTVTYLKVGQYCCGSNSGAVTLINSPTNYAFKMFVYNPNGDGYDDESQAWIYRIRILIDIVGDIWIQKINSESTAGLFIYGSWQRILDNTNYKYLIEEIHDTGWVVLWEASATNASKLVYRKKNGIVTVFANSNGALSIAKNNWIDMSQKLPSDCCPNFELVGVGTSKSTSGYYIQFNIKTDGTVSIYNTNPNSACSYWSFVATYAVD